MRLLLVRHGQTDSNVARELDTGHPGRPLNDTGLAQAAALVETLADERIDAVYSSDLTRAMQTAAPLAEKLGVEAIAHPGFREIFAGEHNMSTDWQPYLAMFQGWASDPAGSLPGAESFIDFEKRWDAALQQVEAAGHDCAVVVSHGAALAVWVPYAARNMTVGSGASRPLHNTAVIVLEGWVEEGWTAIRWADVDLETA